jgi:hypothetical protein
LTKSFGHHDLAAAAFETEFRSAVRANFATAQVDSSVASSVLARATLLGSLFNLLQNPDLECSLMIPIWEALLEFLPPHSQAWASSCMNLAALLTSSTIGPRSENIRKALQLLHTAASVYTCRTFPERWARIQYALGNAHSKRLSERGTANLEVACVHYKLVHHAQPEVIGWQLWQSASLALVRVMLRLYSNGPNTIKHMTEVISILNILSQHHQHFIVRSLAATISELYGDAYEVSWRYQSDLDMHAKIIESYESALSVFNSTEYPIPWAIVQLKIGIALINAAGLRPDHTDRALTHLLLADCVLSKYASPVKQAEFDSLCYNFDYSTYPMEPIGQIYGTLQAYLCFALNARKYGNLQENYVLSLGRGAEALINLPVATHGRLWACVLVRVAVSMISMTGSDARSPSSSASAGWLPYDAAITKVFNSLTRCDRQFAFSELTTDELCEYACVCLRHALILFSQDPSSNLEAAACELLIAEAILKHKSSALGDSQRHDLFQRLQHVNQVFDTHPDLSLRTRAVFARALLKIGNVREAASVLLEAHSKFMDLGPLMHSVPLVSQFYS